MIGCELYYAILTLTYIIDFPKVIYSLPSIHDYDAPVSMEAVKKFLTWYDGLLRLHLMMID